MSTQAADMTSESIMMNTGNEQKSDSATVTEKIAEKILASEPISEDEAALVQTIQQKELPAQRSPAGSVSAQSQSNAAGEQNFEQAADTVGTKMKEDPGSATSEDARLLQSRQAKVTAGPQVPRDSIASQAQHLASVNEGQTASSASDTAHGTSNGNAAPQSQATNNQAPETTEQLAPVERSYLDRERNFHQVATVVEDKLEHHPQDLTKDEVNLLRSRDVRAHGSTEKGSTTAHAQSVLDKFERGQPIGDVSNNAASGLTGAGQADSAAEKEFQEAAMTIRLKLKNDPASITKAEADHLHSLETRAHGHTDKGGITSQAMSAVSKNAAVSSA